MPINPSGSNSSNAAANDLSTANGLRRLKTLQTEVVELDPASAAQLASSDLDDDQMLRTARSSVSLASRQMTVATMREWDENRQRSQWGKMSPAQQKYYLDAGYAPPGPKKEEYVSWWEHPQHWGAKAIGAVAGAVADRWDRFGLDTLYDNTGLDSLVKKNTSGFGWAFEGMANLADDIKDRPVRAADDQTGQSEAARFRLRLAKTKNVLEKNGVHLSEDEWQNLFYRYGEANKKEITYVTTKTDFDPTKPADQGDQMMKGLSTNVFSAFINGVAKAYNGGSLPSWLEDPYTEKRTENLFAPNPSGANVADNIFEQFSSVADEMTDDKEFSNSALASWNRADNGEEYVSAALEYESLQKLGGDIDAVELAKQVSRGKKVSDYLVEEKNLDPNSEEFQKLFVDLNNNVVQTDEFKDVVKIIKSDDSKFSIGRGMADSFGIDRSSALFTWTSGSIDALGALLLDPMNVLGPATKLSRIARFAIAPSEIAVAAAIDTAKVVSRGEKAFKVVDEGTEGAIKIIRIADNPTVRTSIKEAESVLIKNKRLATRLAEKGVDLAESVDTEILSLVDQEGYPTQFLLDHYDEIQEALIEENRALMVDRLGKSTVEGIGVNEAGDTVLGEVAREMAPLDELENSLSKVDVLLSVMMRTGKPIIDTASNGKMFNWLQKTSLRGTQKWMDRVVEGFTDARNGVPNAIAKLTDDLPYGRVVVPVLVDLETRLAAKGLTGISERADLWKWLQTDGLFRLGTGEITGSNIRGVGNGQYVRDTWRVFGRMTDDVPLLRNRQSLAELPRLTTGNKTLRKFIVASDKANLSILARKENETMLRRLGMWSPRKAAGTLWKLGHHVPMDKWLPLAGEQGIVEFRKLLDMGVLAGIDKEVLDKYFDDFIRGIPIAIDTNIKPKSNLFPDELQEILDVLVVDGPSAIDDLEDEAFSYLSVSDFAKNLSSSHLGSPTAYIETHLDEFYSKIVKVVEEQGFESLTKKDLELLKLIESFAPTAMARNPILASRIMVEKRFMQLLFETAGVFDTEVGRKFADDFLNHLERFRYSPNNEDVFKIRTAADKINEIRIGIMPISNYAGRIGIPNVPEFLKVMNKLSMTSRGLRALNNDFLSSAMTNVWKPLTLMRLGFIPRAAGEEYLAFYARRGIWAPLSSFASNIAENRRGFIFGPLDKLGSLPNRSRERLGLILRRIEQDAGGKFGLNHLSKIRPELWGQLNRVDGGKEILEELANLATVLQFKNKADYMAHIGETLMPNQSKKFVSSLSIYDHLQIASHYHTANIVKNLRSFQFKRLPKQLQRGVLAVMGQTDNAALAEGLGLIDIATVGKAMKRDTAMLLRNPLGQQAFAEQQASIGGMIAPPNGIEDPATQRLVIKTSPFDRTNRGEVILLEDREWTVFDPAAPSNETMLHDVTPLYTLIDNDPIVAGAVTPLVGKIAEDDLITYVEPSLRNTTWAVDATFEGEDLVPSEVLNDIGQMVYQDMTTYGNEMSFPKKIVTESGDKYIFEMSDVVDEMTKRLSLQKIDPFAPSHGSDIRFYFPNDKLYRTATFLYYQSLNSAEQKTFMETLTNSLKDVMDNGLRMGDAGGRTSDGVKEYLEDWAKGLWDSELVDEVDYEDLRDYYINDLVVDWFDETTLDATDLNYTTLYDPEYPNVPAKVRAVHADPIDRQLRLISDPSLMGMRTQSFNLTPGELTNINNALSQHYPVVLPSYENIFPDNPISEEEMLEQIRNGFEDYRIKDFQKNIAYSAKRHAISKPNATETDIYNEIIEDLVNNLVRASFNNGKIDMTMAPEWGAGNFDELFKRYSSVIDAVDGPEIIRNVMSQDLSHEIALYERPNAARTILASHELDDSLVGDVTGFTDFMFARRLVETLDQHMPVMNEYDFYTFGNGWQPYLDESGFEVNLMDLSPERVKFYDDLIKKAQSARLDDITEQQLTTTVNNLTWYSIFGSDNDIHSSENLRTLLDEYGYAVQWDQTRFGSEEEFLSVLESHRDLTNNYVLRSMASPDQWRIDADGNLYLLNNKTGRNSGDSISTAHGPSSTDFMMTWGGDTVVAIDREFAETATRGWGADQPLETELAIPKDKPEIMVPKDSWYIWQPPDAAVATMDDPIISLSGVGSGIGGRYNKAGSRTELLFELEKIIRGELSPADSLFWRSFADGGVETFVNRSIDRGSISRIPVKVARRRNTEKIANEGLEQMRLYINGLPKKTQTMLQQFLQGDIEFAGTTGVGDLFKAAQIDRTTLSSAINNALDVYPTDSMFERLVIEASNRAGKGDTRLMEVLDFMVANPKRVGQSVLNDVPISIANPVADRQAVIAAARTKLTDPNYRYYLDANPRSIQHPLTNRQVAKAPLTGTTTLYSVLVDQHTAELIGNLVEHWDDPLRGFNALRTAMVEKGATPDELALIEQMIVEFDGERVAKAFTDSSMIQPVTVFSNVALTDYNQAVRISDLLTDSIFGAGEYRPYVGFARPDTAPYAEPGKVNVIDADNTYQRIGDHSSAVHITDPFAMDQIEVIDKQAKLFRYNDKGELDDAGQHVVTGHTHDELLDSFAEGISDLVFNSFLNSSNGSYLHEIIGPMHRGTFGVDALAQVAPRDFPRQMVRPTRFVAPQNPWKDLVTYGFSQIINPAIFSIVRSPMYMLGLSDGLEWARSVTNHLRDASLDSRFESRIGAFVGKSGIAKGLDSEDIIIEIQNAWSMIPEHTRSTLNTVSEFEDEIGALIYDGKLNPESVLANADLEDLDLILEWVRADSALEKMNMQIANQRAINDVIPFIDDNKVRSFFQEYVRNLIPFEFAQESFLKRWVKTSIYSPEAFRRVQLLVHGLNSSGFVHDDPTSGKRVFVFPMTESLQELFSRVPGMNAMFGQGLEVPVGNTLTGQVNNILPGVPADFQNLPALSPIGMVPASILSEHFPETKPFVSSLSSGRAVNAKSAKDLALTTLQQFVPANYQRIYAAVTGQDTALTSGEVQKATISAMAQLESQAIVLRAELETMDDKNSEVAQELAQKIRIMSLPDDASDVEISRYVDKVTDWARSNMLIRALLGFAAPTNPSNEFDNEELAPEFGALLQTMDMDEALTVFLSERPDGQPWTVFASAKTTKAPLTPTQQSLAWMNNNRDFMDTYRRAAPWLMPQAKTKDDFSQQAFTDMVAAGFKLIKDPEDWYRDLKFASAANIYFPSKLRKDVALENAFDSNARRKIMDGWNMWADTFKKQHPIFANQLESQINNDAELVLQELSTVLSFSPDELPEIEHIDSLRVMIEGYETYMYEMNVLKGQNSKASRTKRDNLRTGFIDWGQRFVSNTPEMQKVWTSLVLPATELSSTVTMQNALKGN